MKNISESMSPVKPPPKLTVVDGGKSRARERGQEQPPRLTKEQREQNLQAALACARAGIKVFPTYHLPPREGERPDKWRKKPAHGFHPWQQKASSDLETVRGFMKQYPDALPGLYLGGSNLVVIDIDKDTDPETGEVIDGTEEFNRLIREAGPLPPHPVHETPRGGQHHFFIQNPDAPLKNWVGALAGIDARAGGGWVPAPGAVRGDGKEYAHVKGTPSLVGGAK